MLSIQSSESPSIHRRQNSTPTTSRVGPEAQYNGPYNRPTNLHRRGLSLDQNMQNQDQKPQQPLGNGMVSINQGLYRQQQMREPQQQGLHGPGHKSRTRQYQNPMRIAEHEMTTFPSAQYPELIPITPFLEQISGDELSDYFTSAPSTPQHNHHGTN